VCLDPGSAWPPTIPRGYKVREILNFPSIVSAVIPILTPTPASLMAPPHSQSDDQQGLLAENHLLSDLYPITSSKPFKVTGAQNAPSSYHINRLPCRYWKRTLVLVLVPLAVTIYFFWIWLYILSRDIYDAVNYGRYN
jgi:hypothetical protein